MDGASIMSVVENPHIADLDLDDPEPEPAVEPPLEDSVAAPTALDALLQIPQPAELISVDPDRFSST